MNYHIAGTRLFFDESQTKKLNTNSYKYRIAVRFGLRMLSRKSSLKIVQQSPMQSDIINRKNSSVSSLNLLLKQLPIDCFFL